MESEAPALANPHATRMQPPYNPHTTPTQPPYNSQGVTRFEHSTILVPRTRLGASDGARE